VNSIEKLSEIFSKFPGIGPRQAKRFVYYILSRSNGFGDELTLAIQDLKKEIYQCDDCLRFFARNSSGLIPENGSARQCLICADSSRNVEEICIVHKDIDLEAIEKSGTHKGYYFVLGGSLPILEKEPEKRIRVRNLEERIKKALANGLKEVILAMNANAEGENTASFIKELLKEYEVEITILGRGLSTGAELEYVDPETLKNAFLHRTK
jgi:recombination protein RecR